MQTASCNCYLHATGCQALWAGAECTHTMWEPSVRGGEGDSEAVYLVRGPVLSRSFVEPHKPDRRDEPERSDAPAPRHAPRNDSWHLVLSRTIRRKASCCRSRRRRGIGKALGLLLSEIRQEHQDVAHRNHADQFSTLRHAEMSNTLLGHQIAGI